jgi:L-lactate dehydrogenase complex protein LldG
MSEQSRERIFARLAAGRRQPSAPIPQPEPMPVKTYSRTEKIEKLKTLMEAMRTEVHITDAQNWIHKLAEILKQRELKSLVYPPQTALGDTLESHWKNDGSGLPQLIPYEKKIEDFKNRLFTMISLINAVRLPGVQLPLQDSGRSTSCESLLRLSVLPPPLCGKAAGC